MSKANSIGEFVRRLPGLLLRGFNVALVAVCAITAVIFGGMMVAVGAYRIWLGIVQILTDTGSPLVAGAMAPGTLNSSGPLNVLMVVAGIAFIWFGVWIANFANSRSGAPQKATVVMPWPVMAGGPLENADAHLRTLFRPFESDAEALKAWNDAVALERQGRHATAATVFRRLAEDHFKGAALAIATLLEDGGPDLTPDPVESRRWYEIALAEADDRGRTSMLFGAFLLVEADKTGGNVGLADRQRGIALLWRAVELGSHEAVATLALCHLWPSKLAAADLNEAERVASEARRRGLLLGDWIDARILLGQGHRFRAVQRSVSVWFRCRAIARANQDDPRLIGMAEFGRALSGDHSGMLERCYGLRRSRKIGD